ncbi:MAG: DNA polymerase I [Anaerolineae bacterium]|nr:DNA polymerase I [Anaerolineae bacterium]
MNAEKRPVLIMIDGHALAYRQFFALPLGSFTTPEGEPTNATFGFARTLLDILEKDEPDYLLVTFDRGLSGRDEMYGDYKGTRDKMPDELRVQMQRIRELVQAFNIPIMEKEGYEADDVLGTLADQAEEAGLDVLIVTGDRDLLQLVTERIRVQLPGGGKNKSEEPYDLAAFAEKYENLTPPQLVDLKGLMGDSSDNIPGVKGIGEKGGVKLLQAYGTLEGVYENLEAISKGQRSKLEESRELAFLSRELARIRYDIPVTLDLEACVAQDYDRAEVSELFRQLHFRALAGRLTPDAEAAPTGGATQLSMFGDAPAEDAPPPADVVDTTIVRDRAGLEALVEALNQASAISFDTETTSTDQMAARLVGIALAVDGEAGYYIPVGHVSPAGEGQAALLDEDALTQLPLEDVLAALRGPLTNPDIPKYGHNAKYDLVVLRRCGLNVTPIAFDTMVAEWLSVPDSRNKGLKNLAWVRLGVQMTEIDTLIGSGKNEITMDRVPVERAAPYAAADAALTYRLVEELRPELEEKKVLALYADLEMPLIPILADMEMAGIALDKTFLAEMSETLAARLEALEADIHENSGGYGPFNINSPKQLNDVLFGKLQLPAEGIRKTTHGFSTSADVLEDLRDKHPIIELILEHRELTKLKGTYVDALPALVNPDTGRVHTSFNQTGTVTGRISSDNPNLQNIPVRTELGRQIRKAFTAPEGRALLAVDYSQVELRVLAHISQDPTLLDAFRQGQDIHRTTAAAVHGIPFEEVTYDQRRFAKSVNFGLLYGMGAFRLARDSDLTLGQAESFIKAYFERFPRVRAYLDETKVLAAEQGYLETLMGRRRYFPELQHSSSTRTGALARQRAERQAINMPIQGTAADIMKLAMIQVHDRLRATDHDARLLLQVHDELVLEVAEDDLHPVAELVSTTMEQAFTLDAPLKADTRWGHNWLEMNPLTG